MGRIKALQKQIMDKKAAFHAQTHGGQLEASSKKPLRTSFPQTSPRIKALQKQIMQERAEILARHPEYDTWAEYKVKEQAKADKLQGQYRQRRRMPAASIHPRIRALQMKIMQERSAIRIKALQKKIQKERAAILAKYPEYETWAEYQADMTPDMIRH